MKNKNSKRGNKLQICFVLALAAVLLPAFFVFKNVFASGCGTVLISEIKITGGTGRTNNDFVEFFNASKEKCNLNGYLLVKRAKTDNGNDVEVYAWKQDAFIESGGYYLWANNIDGYSEAIGADVNSEVGIANDNGIALRVGTKDTGTIADAIAWGGALNNFAKINFFNKNPGTNKSIERNFSNKQETEYFLQENPNPQNSFWKKEEIPEEGEEEKIKICTEKIRIVKIVPFGKEQIELENSNDFACNLKEWSVSDELGWDSEDEKLITKDWGYHRKEISEDFIINPQDYAEIEGSFYLNDDADTVKLFDPLRKKIQSVGYEKGKIEYISYIFNGQNWQWEKSDSPDAVLSTVQNENVATPKIKKDNKIYVGISASFEVSKKSDEKVSWNFGDGHRSYKAITKHKYETAGAYAASVKVYRGKTNAVQNFVVTVEEYPRPKIRIVAINANPKGSDTKKETITLENKTKEKINLKGWSVATGWKKFVNHPIREDFEIKPGKKKELTRDKCAFTLVNDKNKIELRYPDGEVADEVKYKKPEGIKEGEIYEKKKRGWKWILPKNQELGIVNQEKKQKVKVDNKRNQSLGINNQSVESEKEMQNSENIGNQTMTIENAKVVILPENKIELAVTKINAESKVLSTQNLREDEAMYYFTSSIARQEHYMIVFLKKLNSRINMFLNYFLD